MTTTPAPPGPDPMERRFIRQVWVTVDVGRHGTPEDYAVAAWWMARARRQRLHALWARHARRFTPPPAWYCDGHGRPEPCATCDAHDGSYSGRPHQRP